MDTPKGIIIILHNGFAKVGSTEVINALPKEWVSLDRKLIEINYSEMLDLSKLYETGYGQFALEHRRFFSNNILPVINENPDYKILYFGLAPIPLCIDLGHLFCNFRDIVIYQKHHVSKEWYCDSSEASKENILHLNGVPEREQKGLSEALIRLNISHHINQDDTFRILPNAAEIEVSLDQPNEDAVDGQKKMGEIGEAIKHCFDELSNNRSNLEVIHLFAAIPCGVAFLTGTKISPNIHTLIQTYQYSRTKEPKYKKALLIKGQIVQERKISIEEKERADQLRKLSNGHLLTEIKNFCKENEKLSAKRTWYYGLIPQLKLGIMNESFWTDLPALYETSLRDDEFDFETEVVNDGFYWRMNKWYVDDNFFIALGKRLNNTDDILMAVRLFLFHEAVHYKRHGLTDITSVNIGSFPKVLETADYQADVYGLMNEYSFTNEMKGEIGDPKQFFLKAIKIATETMWCFDDSGAELEEIQIRRLNRYMNWYWQYARIEQNGNSLDDIISILEEKPVIELNGLKTKEENNRFFFELEKRNDQPLELGTFYQNRLVRNGSATNLILENLVKGVKQMNGDMILNVMRGFVSQ